MKRKTNNPAKTANLSKPTSPRYRIAIGTTKPNQKLNELGRQAQNWVMVECVLTWAKIAQDCQLSIAEHIEANLAGDILISKELYNQADGFEEGYSHSVKVLEESNMDYDIRTEWTEQEWERIKSDPNGLAGLNYLFHSTVSDGLWNEQNYLKIKSIQPTMMIPEKGEELEEDEAIIF